MSQHADTVSTDLAAVATATPEQLAAARMKLQVAAQRARERLAEYDAAILEHMEAAGVTVLVVSESLELRAVVDKTTKLRKDMQVAAFIAVLEAERGDVDRAAGYLGSDCFKPAACRSVLPPEEYAQLFETVVKTRLEGKPAKKLAVVNPKLLPQGATNHD